MDSATIRVGGIYALEHLMRESTADHPTIVDVLAAFVRENSQIRPVTDEVPSAESAHEPRPPADVQAALTVLARRPDQPALDRIDLAGLDLRGADLRWAHFKQSDLTGTRFDFANLSGARLEEAFLRGARFSHAWLVDANLSDADLIFCDFQEANLGGAILIGADLRMSKLQRAHMRKTDLSSASLSGADFEGSYLLDANLYSAQLAGMPLSGRVVLSTRGYHSVEREQDRDTGGAVLRDADLTRANLEDANLATDPYGEPAPVIDVTVEQLALAKVNEATKLTEALRQGLSDFQDRLTNEDN